MDIMDQTMVVGEEEVRQEEERKTPEKISE